MPINKHTIAAGRSLTELDVELGLRVCVIGRLVVQKLWPDRPDFNPIGETIKINDRPFKVVGVFDFYEREADKRRREVAQRPRRRPKMPRPGQRSRQKRTDARGRAPGSLPAVRRRRLAEPAHSIAKT